MSEFEPQPQRPRKEAASMQSFNDIVGDLDNRVHTGDLQAFRPIPTHFAELDAALGGGFRQGQLILLSGQAGIGKTSFAMQIARNIASSHQAVCLFVCYEHDTDYMAQRLISMESIGRDDGTPSDGLRLRDIADLVSSHQVDSPNKADFVSAIASDKRGARALERISHYNRDIFFVKGNSFSTDLAALADLVAEARAAGGPAGRRPVVLFVDYLQKIAATTPHSDEEARSIEALEGLKDMALGEGIIVMAIVAAQVEGLKSQRLRLEHLLASAEIAYEADIVMTMNEKYAIVDRQHIEFNRYNAQSFHQFVILSIEKNRMGSDMVDLELHKQLQFCRFRTDAERVRESLISGSDKSMIG